MLVGWLCVLRAPNAHADEDLRYVVQPGDSCRSIARAVYGDRARIDVIHAYNRWLGPTPHRLQEGTTLVLPSRERASHEASMARVVHEVELRRAAADAWRRARRGDGLDEGNQVATGEHSAAELLYRDGSRLQMRDRSLVVVVGGGGSSARPRRVARLQRGALRGRLGELAGGLAVQTDSARADVGGEAIVQVDEDTTRVANLGGSLFVTGDRGRLQLPEGSGTTVTAGRRPTPPRPLPRAPRWRDDRSGRFVGVTGSGGTLRGQWHAVEGARAYRVEVSAEADGSELVAAIEVPGDATGFEIARLPAGAYYVRVSTIDSAFFEGRPSPRRAMVIREARIVPPGGGDPPPDSFDPGDPTRPYEPVRVLPGTWLVSPLGLRCGVSSRENAALEGITTVRGLGRQSIRCIDSSDRDIPGFDVLVMRAQARVVGRPVLRRGGRRELTLRIRSPLRLPDRLVARAPPGVAVGSILRHPDGRFRVTIGTSIDVPAQVEVALQVAAGTERIDVATLSLAVPPVRRSPRSPRTRPRR